MDDILLFALVIISPLVFQITAISLWAPIWEVRVDTVLHTVISFSVCFDSAIFRIVYLYNVFCLRYIRLLHLLFDI